MSHIGSRRHRLNVDEAPHVYALVHGRLQQLVMDHNPFSSGEETGAYSLFGEALSLFRLLWRMDHNRPGKPEYPEPVTWTHLENYLGEAGAS